MCIYMLIIYLLLTCYGYHLNTITQYDKLIDFTFKYSIMYFNVFYFKFFLASCCPFFFHRSTCIEREHLGALAQVT